MSQKKLRIVGGGLTGILSAFVAYEFGYRDIELYERFAELGGVALSLQHDHLELRTGCLYFGPKTDVIRQLLEKQGSILVDFNNCFASVSLAADGSFLIGNNFGGPVIDSEDDILLNSYGDSLASRISAYPTKTHRYLDRYIKWHLSTDPALIHESAAIPLAINRVFPAKTNIDALKELKQNNPLYDELYAIPRELWSHKNNLTASLPLGGFNHFFRGCHDKLEHLGIKVHLNSLRSPKQSLADCCNEEVLIWAASPTPLFKAAGMQAPELLRKTFSVSIYHARFSGPLPFYIHNFTIKGVVFRIYLYITNDETLLVAECVSTTEDTLLRQEIDYLMKPFGSLELGDLIITKKQPRWIYHSLDSINALYKLRKQLAYLTQNRFIAGAWEPYSKIEKYLEINKALSNFMIKE